MAMTEAPALKQRETSLTTIIEWAGRNSSAARMLASRAARITDTLVGDRPRPTEDAREKSQPGSIARLADYLDGEMSILNEIDREFNRIETALGLPEMGPQAGKQVY